MILRVTFVEDVPVPGMELTGYVRPFAYDEQLGPEVGPHTVEMVSSIDSPGNILGTFDHIRLVKGNSLDAIGQILQELGSLVRVAVIGNHPSLESCTYLALAY